MLIHELTTSKKINEGIGEFFGLNNPKVAQIWGELGAEMIHDLSARFTKDPRYASLPLAQRKRAIQQDEYIQRISQQYLDAWNKQLNELEVRNGAALTDIQYQNALANWASKTWYKNEFNDLDPAAQARAKAHFAEITRNRNQPEKIKELFSSLAADQAAREVEVWTTLQKQQPQPQQTEPVAGTPNQAELAKFEQLVAAAAKAQS